MRKLTGIIVAAALGAVQPIAAHAAVLGPHAAQCGGSAPALLVRISGLKARTGTIRVQSYGGDPAHFFDKGTYLERVDVRIPPAGPVEVCMPVPRPGNYAVSVRHDIDGSGKGSLNDGGGMSGNPDLSLMDVVFKRKPSPTQVTVAVRGVAHVPVVLNYVQGTRVAPIGTDSQ
jgi:uncharacterized protein (DUF2141 family)